MDYFRAHQARLDLSIRSESIARLSLFDGPCWDTSTTVPEARDQGISDRPMYSLHQAHLGQCIAAVAQANPGLLGTYDLSALYYEFAQHLTNLEQSNFPVKVVEILPDCWR